MAQPSTPEAPELADPTSAAANSPAFTGRTPMETWLLQGIDSEPWNAIDKAAGPVGGPPLVHQQTAEADDSSTRAVAGSPPPSPTRG